jgi:hypothetical protein
MRFEGTAPGLAEKRLSLSAFGPALDRFLTAYKRTASNVLVSAEGAGSATGRLHRLAESLDLEIESVLGQSVAPTFVATQAVSGPQQALYADLAQTALDRLLQDIDGERKQEPRSKVARAFLQALPIGIARQTYTLKHGDTDVRVVEFGTASIAELPANLPHLVRGQGQVVGVGFAPGEPYVEVSANGKAKPILCRCTADAVEVALSMRSTPVEFLAIGEDNTCRLLWLRDAAKPFKPIGPQERLERIHADWNVTLTALAQ